jgi:dihydrofolate synthase / folylpolyglutamate synthase
MTYAELLERLVRARRFGMKLGLARMRELLDRLATARADGGPVPPDLRLGTVVHVGGTNGKGSTIAMLAALARSAGARVATYTSPHLSTLRERVTIDGTMVSEDEIVDAAERVAAAGGDELTFFEQVTAIAMLIIAARDVDITLLEVGLGGRLDATNVVRAPIAAVTGIALDHEAVLGGTLDAIAFEKAGIFKRGQRAFIGAAGEPDGAPLLVRHARDASVAELHVIDQPGADALTNARIVRAADVGMSESLELSLAGQHQQRNAALALALARALHDMGALHEHADPRTLATLGYPGRFEIAGDLILDGAHNPHGARALAATLRERGLRPVLVLAVSGDKDVRAIARALAGDVQAVIATRYQQERALDPALLASMVREVAEAELPETRNAREVHEGREAREVREAPEVRDAHGGRLPVEIVNDLDRAVARARQLGSPILIAGSLLLVGEARSRFLGAPADPVLVSDPSAPMT